jgi:DNA mismatch repair protein MutS2
MGGEENLESLEWSSLLKHYSAHCWSAPAKLAAGEVTPADSPPEAERLIELTAQARIALELGSFSFLSGLEDLSPTIARLKKSSVMDGKELLSLARLAEISAELKKTFSGKEAADCPDLTAEASGLPDLSRASAPVRHAIDTDGSVRDSASPLLRSLRDQERKLHSEAREQLDHVLQQSFRDGYLQDKYFDFRDGRYIVPVKTEFRNKVRGFVVESSSTRATVFMEPASVRDCNDRIKQTELLIEEEIYRILGELSRALHPHGEEFAHAYETSLGLDLVLARGAFANEYESIRGVSRPEFTGHFLLEGLYHPLLGFVLKPDRIVRNTFVLGPKKKVLVISGPNTGGKTVLLKAVGLSALMARAGFFLPCAGGARLPFFSGVLAQIGDAQDIELSLSSFSGSILHLKSILERAEKNTLVLVDEILHATDPDEATALSRAILQALQAEGSFAVVTTHLNGLKVSGQDEFESASMEFDHDQLLPTYRLRTGVPGSSRALEIAQKLGLSPRLIEIARSYLSRERVKEQSAVDQLEARERELQNAKQELENARAGLRLEQERLREANREMDSLRRRFRAEASEKVKEQRREAMQEVERVISAYRKKLISVDQKHRASEEAQEDTGRLKEKFQKIEEALEEIAPTAPAKEAPREEDEEGAVFAKNAPVKIPSMKTTGILLSEPDEKKPEVMLGNIRMKMSWEQLEPMRRARPPAGSRPYATASDHSSVSPELHLLGKTVSEAEALLSSYLDRASRSGRPWVRIVHGHGSGALKKAVREALRSSPYEMKYRPGTAAEGGEGCTVVEFV